MPMSRSWKAQAIASMKASRRRNAVGRKRNDPGSGNLFADGSRSLLPAARYAAPPSEGRSPTRRSTSHSVSGPGYHRSRFPAGHLTPPLPITRPPAASTRPFADLLPSRHRRDPSATFPIRLPAVPPVQSPTSPHIFDDFVIDRRRFKYVQFQVIDNNIIGFA